MKGPAGRFAAIARLGEEARSGMDPAALLQRGAVLVVSGLSADASAVVERSAADGSLQVSAGAGEWEDPREKAAQAAGALATFALESDGPVVMKDSARETRFDARALTAAGMRCGAAVAIPGHDAPAGVLMAVFREPYSPSFRDIHFMQAAAHVLHASLRMRDVLDALRAQDAAFGALFRSEAVPLFYWRGDGVITQANEAFLRFTGATRADLEAGALRWDTLVDRRTKKRIMRRLLEHEPGLPPMEIEVRAGSRRVPVLACGSRLPGIHDGGIAVAIDLSERRFAEQEIRRLNETLEQRVAERTAMAEIRAAQLGALAAELTIAEQRERRRLAQSLHDGLQQLLVAARLRLDRVRAKLAIEDPKAGLEQADELIEQAIEASRVLTIDLSPPVLYEAGLVPALEWLARQMKEKHSLEVDVMADRGAAPESEEVGVFLFHAVRELLFNVVKHARVSRASVAVRRIDAHLEVMVADGGSGFDPAQPHREDRSGKGGFGLFSIRERLELFGGRMEVRSAPGHGTRVVLIAPQRTENRSLQRASQVLQSLAPGRPDPRGEPQPSEGKIRVILADDHTIMRQGLRALLGQEPDLAVVAEASDGEEAVALARRLHPDAVVMDVSMPGINGIEATRRIKTDAPGSVVVALSMYESEDMASAMKAAGASAYLSKDKASEALCGVIRAEVLGQRSR